MTPKQIQDAGDLREHLSPNGKVWGVGFEGDSFIVYATEVPNLDRGETKLCVFRGVNVIWKKSSPPIGLGGDAFGTLVGEGPFATAPPQPRRIRYEKRRNSEIDEEARDS